MQPEQATFLLQSTLPTLKNEMSITQKVLDAVPTDKGDFRPDPVGKSAFELAWHIAAAESLFLQAIVHGEFNFNNPRPESIKTPKDVAEWYKAQSEKNLKDLTHLTGDQLTKIVDFRGMFQNPAVTYITFNLHHIIHHRGQLSMYLRPMGGKVPAIYGESYDSAQAKKAAAN
jgi:uncharacterized damage-inducible protein DinB